MSLSLSGSLLPKSLGGQQEAGGRLPFASYSRSLTPAIYFTQQPPPPLIPVHLPFVTLSEQATTSSLLRQQHRATSAPSSQFEVPALQFLPIFWVLTRPISVSQFPLTPIPPPPPPQVQYLLFCCVLNDHFLPFQSCQPFNQFSVLNSVKITCVGSVV